ncbi:putative lipoprotein [Cystobacter fuscus DSM 2262]|uniref:Lipoprotein n=1 Tax=Cystobacter fuscus (strain ATCC 25194 / DSM 2262 / NBRC 100088 / M29) TaxID=1242864 RepID=S9PDM4_CYSF2|nr:right-handed parallel beta-helix repeat-containing protein [Cystobacter fuscus]EPX61126.1 putative lipoprotein [Cystobacter fuscus DSM 2262]
MRVRWLQSVVSCVVLVGVVACGSREPAPVTEPSAPDLSSSTTASPAPSGDVSTPAPTAPATPGAPASPSAPSAPTTDSASSPPPPPEFSRILWVSPSGKDSAAGTESAPLRTVEKAQSLLQPGEAIFLKSGTYTERLLLDARDGSSGRYLTLKAAPGAKPVFKGGSGSRTPMLQVSRAYWRVEGITFDAAGDKAFAAYWHGEGAHHGILRGCTLKNGTDGAGVFVAGKARDVLIEGNTISNFQRSGADSHGVCVQTNSKNVTVRANDIHHNSGDGVQCLSSEGGSTEEGTPFDNLLVEDNDLHENKENGADIKTCTRVALRGNRIWGHRRSSTSGGEGVVVHMSARDVTLEDNDVRDNGRGIQIGGVREGAPPTHIVLRRNRVFDGVNSDGSEGSGIRIDTAIDVKVVHNTVWNMPTYGLVVGKGESGASEDVEVRNNILGGCAALAVRVGTEWNGLSFDGNLYSPLGDAPTFRKDSRDQDLSTWQESTGWDAHSVEKAPEFVDAEAGDFWLASSSPGRDAGLAVGEDWCGRAPDMGARESDCP